MKKSLPKIYINLIEPILISVFACFVLLNFVFMVVTVDGSSMNPILENEDKGISFIMPKLLGKKPERFSIVVIDTPLNDDLLVKRVIGLPNEKIEYIDNKLYVNGKYIEESFLGDVITDDFVYICDEDEYYCLGDNRDISRDSRYYGAFSLDEIQAYGVFVFYPFGNFGVK